MRRLRLRFTAAIARFARQNSANGAVAFTIISRKWQVAPEALLSTSPQCLLRALRADLNRCGANNATGSLIAAIDLDFEPVRRIFVLHLHGVAFGDMVDVLNGLRRRPKYRPLREEREGLVPVFRPIMIIPLVDDNLRAFTYILKSYWTSTWRGRLGPSGKFRTARQGQRIPEPYHSLALLWVDRFTLQDITLLVGMEAGSFGFRRTPGRSRTRSS